MGSTINCNNCCLECQRNSEAKLLYTPKNRYDEYKKTHPDFMEAYVTVPDPAYARPVSNVIDLKGSVRKAYREHKQPQRSSIADNRGTFLQSFYIFSLNAYYEGEWKHGLPHGHGRFYYDCGSFLQGTLNQGVIEGDKELYIFPNGSFYKGAFKCDKGHGHGSFKSPDIEYVGEWADSQPHGKGIQVTKDCRYEGEFVSGKKEGKGKIVWSNDVQYIGDFKNNEMEGRGILKTKAYTYEGEMSQSKKSGYGKLTYKNNNSYQGDFVRDNREGTGIFTWQNGAKFIGTFHNDKQNGFGRMTMPNGSVLEGRWVDGEFVQSQDQKQSDEDPDQKEDKEVALKQIGQQAIVR